MIGPEEIRRRIEQALPGASVAVRDLTGGGDHYEVDVVSAAFAGMATLQRHRLVHAPLRDVLGGALHAIALRTRTPDEV
jgi:stress-induced morphogen